ncbi:MAG: LysM peptidoglycan-binding domain-containing protein [Bacteroidota bacterium]
MLKQPVYILVGLLFGCLLLTVSAQETQEVEITNVSTTPQTIDGEEYYLHAVLQGQTLYSIARAYGVEQEVIIEENPEIRDGLRYDQIIRIPVEESDVTREEEDPGVKTGMVPPDFDNEFIEHEVKPQETLYGLSRQYGTAIEEILFYNPQAREGLKVAQVLKIPVQPDHGGERDYRLYTVSPGETKFAISREFDLTVEALDEMNPGIEEGLRAGQQIRVPLREDVGEKTEPDPPGRFIFLPPDMHVDEPESIDDYCYEPDVEDHYDVALLIPLYLEEVAMPFDSLVLPNDFRVTLPDALMTGLFGDNINLFEPQEDLSLDYKSFSFLSYYHGVLLALDSIRQRDVDITLHVYDVCRDMDKARAVTARDDFEELDLIIGPFFRQSLQYVTAEAEKHDIPVVSPLLPDQQQLSGYPGLFNAMPSLDAMLQEVAGYVAQNYPKQNIIIVHNNQPGAVDIIESFQDTLLTRVATVNHFYDSLNLARVNGYYFDSTLVGSRRTNLPVMPDTASTRVPATRRSGIHQQVVPRPANVNEVIYLSEGMEGVKDKMRRDRKNVLITLISGEPFLSNYLRQLHGKRSEYDISIFGIPEWQNYTSIEIDYLQDLKVHIFTSNYYDYQDPYIRSFVKEYRRMFLTEPDDDAFKGVQTAYFFFNALMEYGNEFARCMTLLNQLGYNSPFIFKQPLGDESGYENQHTFIYRIQDYTRVEVQKPIKLTDKGE